MTTVLSNQAQGVQEASAPLLLEEASAEQVRAGLRARGAVLLRRAGGRSLAEFESLADELMTPLVHHAVAGMEREPVSADGATATVNKGRGSIPLHRELSYAPGAPDLLMFLCQTPPTSGGQTILCDGVVLFEALDEATRDFLRTGELVWRWEVSPARWRSALGVTTQEEALTAVEAINGLSRDGGSLSGAFEGATFKGAYRTGFVTRPGDGLREAFCNSVLVTVPVGDPAQERVSDANNTATLGDGSAFPDLLLRDIAARAEAVTYDMAWQAGDIVVLDNTRYLHGRRSILDTERRILTRVGHSRRP
ncbi:MAG: TauD/TfdA family dioxygenase [Streptomyces sp.]|uniref:TauD/TfdA family dioxygenase n=1 Tax=Streptomyces sp. TaxID=1931 RepID=UPI0025F92672|nr:TauD/TfdA family dioxygenase [Streptomyces sp.]MBW8800922.1 TauD/TfdA family dioxygenase [Streptomyces sp.]